MKGEKITDEGKIISACKEGKSWAQKAIYDKYATAMMSICFRYSGNRETARDLLQDGFIKVFTKIDTYYGLGSFAGWIRRIFVTTSLEYLRQNDALRNRVDIDEIDPSDMHDESQLQKMSADDLFLCIARLSDGYRTVFNLYAIEGYSHAEIADILNISEATSRSQYMRARKVLQQNVKMLFENEYKGK